MAMVSISEAGAPATSLWNSTSGLSWAGKDPSASIDFGMVYASSSYGKTIGWELKEGRGFSKDMEKDTTALIINEAAGRAMNLKHPVGENLSWFGQPFRIIGVIGDMVIESPYDEPKPVVHGDPTGPGDVAIIKLSPSVGAKEAVDKIGEIFKKFNTDQPFEYSFVDDDYAKKFDNEERVGKLANVFSMLAVIISCLGLFGLTSFVAEQRTKEIGVRKVLCATVLNLWKVLSAEFVILVLISFLIAVPLSYYFMQHWLQNYSYRAQLSCWIFVLAGAGVLMITVLTKLFFCSGHPYLDCKSLLPVPPQAGSHSSAVVPLFILLKTN